MTKNLEKILLQYNFDTTNSTWTDSGANPGLRGERPVT
jgi:hypothetical protein